MAEEFRLELNGLRGYGESVLAVVLVAGGAALAIFEDLTVARIFGGAVLAPLGILALLWNWFGSELLLVKDGKLRVERRLWGGNAGRDLQYAAASIKYITVDYEQLPGFEISYDFAQKMGLFRGPVVLRLTNGEAVRVGEGLTYGEKGASGVAIRLAAALGVEYRETRQRGV